MSAMISAVAVILSLLLAVPSYAPAQSRSETLLVLVESGPNSMDIHGVGANFRTYGASWNLYDRLLTYGAKTLADGTRSYDHTVLKGELAESYPEYFFLWTYHGQNSLFNTSSYQNPEMDKLIEAAHLESDPKKYGETVRAFTRIALADVPKVPLMQPALDVAMQKTVTGYQYWFHRQLDFRTLAKQ